MEGDEGCTRWRCTRGCAGPAWWMDVMSTREAARVFGLHRDTVSKMLQYSAPPGYRRRSPPRRPKLDPYRGVIDRILEDDRSLPRKQRHTAKRIYERLRTEHELSRQVHDSQRLRPRAASEDTGDVRTAVACSRARSVRFRPGQGRDRRSGADRPLLRPGPTPQRRVLHQGLPRGDYRGVLRRSRLGVLLPRRCAA